MAFRKRGDGFVQPNTPASISYTGAITRAEVERVYSRLECVTLPALSHVWRAGLALYEAQAGLPPLGPDALDAKAGAGPLRLPVAEERRQTGAAREHRSTGVRTSFFVGRLSRPVAAGSESAASAAAAATASPGITLVSNHKVSGTATFVYPDYDGVLSAGAVLRVVDDAADKDSGDAAGQDKLYVSPHDMSEAEREAYEALQAEWRRQTEAQRRLAAVVHGKRTRAAAAAGEADAGDDTPTKRARREGEGASDSGDETENQNTLMSPEEAMRLAEEMMDF